MSRIDCGACQDLRDNAAEFVQNGVTDKICTSLQNDTGLNPNLTVTHTDCEDLDTANDCLIGQMDDQLESYDVCDWKKFMHRFIPNLYELLKAMICAICGIWTNIHNIWKQITKINCEIEHLSNPPTDTVLTPDDPRVKYREVAGVSTRYDPAHPKLKDVPLTITTIGAAAMITGSIHLEGNMPADYTSGGSTGRVEWLDFYNGGTDITTKYGRKSHNGNFPLLGVLLYEYEVNACDWGFSDAYSAPLFPTSAGEFVARIYFIKPGEEYPYDCGADEDGNGQKYRPSSSKYNMLIQVRLMSIDNWGIASNSGNITPNGMALVKPCAESWEC